MFIARSRLSLSGAGWDFIPSELKTWVAREVTRPLHGRGEFEVPTASTTGRQKAKRVTAEQASVVE
jgi:hypothetical protein